MAEELVGPGGLVVAFEPGRMTFQLLAANVAVMEKVVGENVAVGAVSRTADLRDFGARHSALNTVRATARVPARKRDRLDALTYPVEVTTIDDYVGDSGRAPDFVKIDVEGEELAVLNGMARVMREHSPLISLETGDYDGMDSPRTDESIDLLQTLGYQCLEFRDGGLRPHQRRTAYGYGNLFFVRSLA